MKRLSFHITTAQYNRQKKTHTKAQAYHQEISLHWGQKEYTTSFLREKYINKMGQNKGSGIRMALNL